MQENQLHKQKVIIKIGTNVITKDNGFLDTKILKNIVGDIVWLKKEDCDIVVVTSGAMGAGRALLDGGKIENPVSRRQVLAAIGQVPLMQTYSRLFQKHIQLSAQVLATKEDFRDRTHYLNMRNCFLALLDKNIIPLVNENDVVSVTELMFTDNDELAGLVSTMLNAESLIILTNVDGVFTKNPKDPEAKLLEEIHPLTETYKFVTEEKSKFGRGGMHSKFAVAKKLATLGIETWIANGTENGILKKIFKRQPSQGGKHLGTRFVPEKKLSNIKTWIAQSQEHKKGLIRINACAVEALRSREKAHSLLLVGVTQITGNFHKGDIVEIQDEKKKTIGFGISQYDGATAKNSLGEKGRRKKPLIHYNYLVLV